MFSLMGNGRYGVSNLEGGLNGAAAINPSALNPPLTAPSAEGLPFRALQDPRVPFAPKPGNGLCFTTSIRCWLNNNYPTLDADVPLASGVEARLIEAEAALQAGNAALMMTRLNDLRASVVTLLTVLYPDQKQTFPPPGTGGTVQLAALTDPGAGLSAADAFTARRNLLFQERALWLYNTGHRLGDLRRLVRNYGLPSTSVFPTGPHFRGSNYGNDVSFPPPFQENNNPSYDPAACITTKA
jgi:hypothetical protein